MKCAVFLCVIVAVATLVPGGMCDRSGEQDLVLRRNRRTIQFLVNHFASFFGLSGGGGTKKVEPKQDNAFALPFTSILKASAGKLSGVSGPKQKPKPPNREPTLDDDLPTWIDDRPQKISNPLSEAFEAESLEPTRVSLLSTTREPEETTTTSTSTEAPMTTTPEMVPVASTEPAVPAEPEASEDMTAQPEQEDAPQTSVPETDDSAPEDSEGSTSTETSAVDPASVNTLSENGVNSRFDAREENFQPTPIPLVSYQHYVQPAVWPGAGFQQSFPMHQYFGNNVFLPTHQQNLFPLASPFQVQAVPAPHVQGYPSVQPLYDNRLYYPTDTASQAKSHSRVKLHDNHYDLVTYHDDTEQAASNYQSQAYGNYQAR